MISLSVMYFFTLIIQIYLRGCGCVSRFQVFKKHHKVTFRQILALREKPHLNSSE